MVRCYVRMYACCIRIHYICYLYNSLACTSHTAFRNAIAFSFARPLYAAYIYHRNAEHSLTQGQANTFPTARVYAWAFMWVHGVSECMYVYVSVYIYIYMLRSILGCVNISLKFHIKNDWRLLERHVNLCMAYTKHCTRYINPNSHINCSGRVEWLTLFASRIPPAIQDCAFNFKSSTMRGTFKNKVRKERWKAINNV